MRFEITNVFVDMHQAHMSKRTDMIQVNITVFATLRRYLPDLAIGEAKTIQIKPGTTLAEIRDLLNLPEEEVKVIMRNNIQADSGDLAKDGDRIAFIPAVAGG